MTIKEDEKRFKRIEKLWNSFGNKNSSKRKGIVRFIRTIGIK